MSIIKLYLKLINKRGTQCRRSDAGVARSAPLRSASLRNTGIGINSKYSYQDYLHKELNTTVGKYFAKGKISEISTQEGESFVHGETVKKLPDNSTFIKHGYYTTCDAEHPHYYIAAKKIKVIPNNKADISNIFFNYVKIQISYKLLYTAH